jgi:hypothetical protein
MKDIFLITSVINTGNYHWSYTHIRSVFSPQERFEQTLQTIESIRALKDDSIIFLVECSNINKEMEDELKKKVDIYLQLYDNELVRTSCINTEKKGYGEVMKTIKAVEYLQSNNIQFNRFFKISGRYYLNNSFSKTNFSEEKYSFSKKWGIDSHSTVLYSVPYAFIKDFYDKLLECELTYISTVIGLEDLLPKKCNPKIEIEHLGVSGYVAIDKYFYNMI